MTVVEFGEGWWEADVSDETLSRTSLATLGDDDGVNLERVVRASDRLGGHIVQGHVDGVGEIVDPVPTSVSVYPTDCCAIWSRRARSPSMVSASRSSSPLADGLTVAIIPHTAYVTTLGTKRPGDLVNVEVDVMAKYVERLVLAYLPPETGAP